MKVKGFTIENFARPELTMGGPLSLTSVSGGDILIRGENQSGKTHTFNAILYCLLGETIELQTGHGNSVEVQLTDDFTIYRGESGRKVRQGDEAYGPDDADDVIRQTIGPRNLIHSHFLHSRISELPLESFTPSDRIDRVLAASNEDLGERITELREQIEQLQEEAERRQAELNSLSRDKSRRKRQVSHVKSQYEKWSTVEELAETGRLEEISAALQKDPELEKQIDGLTSRKRGLITDIRAKQNEQTRAEELKEETREIIIKALEEFICPVCEERVNRTETNSRLDEAKCPFCHQSTDIQDTVENLEREKQQSEGRFEEINRELSELREERDEIDSRIESLKEERPEISELNTYGVDLLKEYNHDIQKIRTRASEKRAEAEEELENYSQMVSDIEDKITGARHDLHEIDEAREEKEQAIEQLENENVSTRITEFEELWNHHYQSIAPQVAQQIKLNRGGEIVLEIDDNTIREYDRRGDLSDSEIVLLNISFVVALNEIALEHRGVDWETIVMDEPFARLDQGLKQDALEYLKNQGNQVILTSSDEYVWQEFGHASTLNLERQTQLTDFTDD